MTLSQETARQTLGAPFSRLGRRRPRWERRYAATLPFVDAAMLVAAVLVAKVIRSLAPGQILSSVTALQLAAGVTLGWVALLAAGGAYESRLLGQGPDEYKRVARASWQFAAVLAVGSYIVKAPLARGFFLLVIPLGTVSIATGRHCVRRVIAWRRSQGKSLHRIVVVGPAYTASEVIREIDHADRGFKVVGVCTSGTIGDGEGSDIPVMSDFDNILPTIIRTGADTVAVVGSADMPTGFIRRLAWQLEGTGVDLMVSPAITDVAGPRIHVRPVAKLSLLYVEEPRFTGMARVAKASVDRILAALFLLLAAPVMLVTALAVKASGPGPVLFRQRRLGFGGKHFTMWKFRTMHADVDALSVELASLNEADGALFKVREDPRVTRVGRVLRRLSLDELPQLWNVVTGHMSLVGPRPLPQELAAFAPDERRRMLVKPGMTGLWQVSGRSDLTWEESVRLDLYYVENWSLAVDFLVLARTVAVVLRRRGAY